MNPRPELIKQIRRACEELNNGNLHRLLEFAEFCRKSQTQTMKQRQQERLNREEKKRQEKPMYLED